MVPPQGLAIGREAPCHAASKDDNAMTQYICTYVGEPLCLLHGSVCFCLSVPCTYSSTLYTYA